MAKTRTNQPVYEELLEKITEELSIEREHPEDEEGIITLSDFPYSQLGIQIKIHNQYEDLIVVFYGGNLQVNGYANNGENFGSYVNAFTFYKNLNNSEDDKYIVLITDANKCEVTYYKHPFETLLWEF